MMNAFELSGVCFKYTDRWVLDDISLHVAKGEIFGIIGPNGSGKSSLLRIMGNLNIPQKGDLYLHGEATVSLNQMDFAKRVAFVPQESHFLFPFTVAEIVLMGRTPHMKGRLFETFHDKELAMDAMRLMDIEGLSERPVTDISGGEKQRAIIARALVQEPEVLILDEPTASLDIGHQIEIYELFERLNMRSTIILSSHDLNLASQYCHRLMLLHQGKIYAVGTPAEVITEENISRVYGCNVIVDKHPLTERPRVTLTAGEISRQ